jgi:hypothetical protein
MAAMKVVDRAAASTQGFLVPMTNDVPVFGAGREYSEWSPDCDCFEL